MALIYHKVLFFRGQHLKEVAERRNCYGVELLVRDVGRGNPRVRQEISSTLFVCYRQTTTDAGHFNATYRFAHQGADDTERHKGFVAGTAVGLSSQQYLSHILAPMD